MVEDAMSGRRPGEAWSWIEDLDMGEIYGERGLGSIVCKVTRGGQVGVFRATIGDYTGESRLRHLAALRMAAYLLGTTPETARCSPEILEERAVMCHRDGDPPACVGWVQEWLEGMCSLRTVGIARPSPLFMPTHSMRPFAPRD